MPSPPAKSKRALGVKIKQLFAKMALDKRDPKSVLCVEIMKNSPMITVLVMAACVLGFVVVALAVDFEWQYRRLRHVQPRLVQSQNTRTLVNQIANDALEYSKTHPAIDPILAPVGVKPARPGSASSSKPAAK
jgi:hypothetical protein